jgi:hypothetical protein
MSLEKIVRIGNKKFGDIILYASKKVLLINFLLQTIDCAELEKVYLLAKYAAQYCT